MVRPIAWYREFVPCNALRAHLYAIFSFVPGSASPPPHRPLLCEIPFRDPTFCSPQFADGHVSMLFELGHSCGADGRWRSDGSAPRGSVTGPMSEVGRTKGSDRPDMVGVYFRGRVTIDALAHDAGASRQHFSRQFREHLGIPPKLYSRLARFHSGLAHVHAREKVDWAGTALDLGYADQSHMIAEFRQFSALTPQALVCGHWFHPFIERAMRTLSKEPRANRPSIARGRQTEA